MLRNRTFNLAVLAIAAALGAGAAIGAEEHSHEGKHGGKIVESGHHHVEIIAKDGSLEIFVNGEDGQPEDIKDAKATATVLSEGKKVDLTLAPDASNSLKGTGDFKATKGTIIVLTFTMPGHKPEQARLKLE